MPGIMSSYLMGRSLEATHMEVVELEGLSAVDCPDVTSIEKSGQNYCVVDLQLCHPKGAHGVVV